MVRQVSRTGQPWQLKQCCESRLWKQLNSVDMVLTSPPYNIGSKSPKRIGGRRLGGYDSKSWGAIEGYSDSLPEEDYQRWQRNFLERYASILTPGGVIAYNHKERHVRGQLIQPESWFPPTLTLFDKVVWDRRSTHNHCPSYAYQQHEYVYLLRRTGERHHHNNVRLDSVVSIPPASNVPHNAPMALELAVCIIAKFCPSGGLVVDPFAGSGTTAIAALSLGRRFVGCEKERKYHRMASKRLKEEAA